MSVGLDDLVGWWHPTNNPGGFIDTIADKSSNSNDAIHNGGGGFGWWRDDPLYALTGQASTNVWQTNIEPLPSNPSDFTFSLWHRNLDTGLNQSFGIIFYNTSSPYQGWGFRNYSGGTYSFWDSNSWQDFGPRISPDLAWHHYLVRVSGTNADCYADGALIGSITIGVISPWTGRGTFNRGSEGLSYYDNMLYFGNAVTDEEVAELYAGGDSDAGRAWEPDSASGPPLVHPLSGFGHPLRRPGVVS